MFVQYIHIHRNKYPRDHLLLLLNAVCALVCICSKRLKATWVIAMTNTVSGVSSLVIVGNGTSHPVAEFLFIAQALPEVPCAAGLARVGYPSHIV